MVDLFLAKAKIDVIPLFLSTYRLHETSITNSGKLEEKMNASRRIRFRKLMGREQNGLDRVVTQFLRAQRIVTRPRQALERLFKGPVFRCKVGESADGPPLSGAPSTPSFSRARTTRPPGGASCV